MPTITRQELQQLLAQKQQQQQQPPAQTQSPDPSVWSVMKSGALNFANNAAKGLVSPVARTIASGVAPIQAAGQAAMGDTEGANKTLNEGYNVPWLGQVKPLKIGTDIQDQKTQGVFGKNTEETIGVGAQTAALGMGGEGLLPAIAGGATFGAGSGMEQKEGVGGVAANTALGAGTGAVLHGAGKTVEKGVRKALQPVMEKIAPFVTNIPKTDWAWAKNNLDKIAPKVKMYADATAAGTPEDGESVLRQGALAKGKDVYAAAKTAAQNAYKEGITPVLEKYKDAQGSLEAIRGSVVALAKQAGEAVSADESKALQAVYDTVNNTPSGSLDHLIGLSRNMDSLIDRLDPGTPAHRVATLIDKEINLETERMTNDAMKPINKAYAAFKKASEQVKPLWSNSVKEDTARNFVTNLNSIAKSGSRDAIKYLEKLGGKENVLLDEVKSNRIAKAFNWEKAPPGSRIRDELVKALMASVPAAGGGLVGNAVGGPVVAGAAGFAAGTAGSVLGTKLTSPEYVSRFVFDQLNKEGIKLPGAARQIIGKILQDPNLIKGLLSGEQGDKQSPDEVTQ